MNAQWRYGAIGVLGAIAAMLKLAATAGAAGMIWIHLCGSLTPGSGTTGGKIGVARSASSSPGISTPFECPQGDSAYGMELLGNGAASAGGRAYWQVDAPQGLSIVGVHTEGSGMASYGVNANGGWGGGFYWKGGGAQAYAGQIAYSSPAINSPYFGWQLICGATKCDGNTKPGEITVLGLELEGAETSGPTLLPAAGSLGATSRWVRGRWPVAFYADGPSGACQLAASLGGLSISQPLTEPQTQLTWHQCPAALFSQSFDTASVGSGPSVPLVMWARDAAYDYQAGAYLSSAMTRRVNIDNAPVALSISGPTDAVSTAGIQQIDVSATAGPSGVSGIACSLDGSPYQFHPGASTRIAVEGIGVHTASCYGQNNAVSTGGEPGTSPTQTWTMSIRQPSLSTASFARVADALRCAKSRERVRIPAHWVTASYHRHRVRIKLPAETRTITVVRCHPHIVVRRVLVHGRWRSERFVVLPHTVDETSRRVPHGASTTISGWLGTGQGNALGGQRVRILTAPDNGLGAFTQAAVAVTAPDGSWTAPVSPGPSRIVRAVFDGTATVEPSTSAPAQIVVPASIAMNVSPHRARWGGKITIRGRLRGGYIPPAGELVVLWIGWPGGSTEIGHLYAGHTGRFRSAYTFLRGNGVEKYRLWAATATESDYPFAAGRSLKTGVTVGP